jgi:hypothetical protein
VYIAIYCFPGEEMIHYIGPFATAEDGYDALCELPAPEDQEIWGVAKISDLEVLRNQK